MVSSLVTCISQVRAQKAFSRRYTPKPLWISGQTYFLNNLLVGVIIMTSLSLVQTLGSLKCLFVKPMWSWQRWQKQKAYSPTTSVLFTRTHTHTHTPSANKNLVRNHFLSLFMLFAFRDSNLFLYFLGPIRLTLVGNPRIFKGYVSLVKHFNTQIFFFPLYQFINFVSHEFNMNLHSKRIPTSSEKHFFMKGW